ncbi:hypothetical protein [Leucobacter viscericola]|uniref:hypothetical protein n=1 Tax=Leucobacter viscericola TaxID=2714935 RepID=UPI00197F4F7C|nr:hypothetical protein [Leucobacter viscericola]
MAVERIVNQGATTTRNPFWRILFFAPAAIALILGLVAGLRLLKLFPEDQPDVYTGVHGPLMVFGFIGTLIALERAVAIRRWWGYASPAFLGSGGIVLAIGLNHRAGQLLLTLGLVVFLAVYRVIWQRQHTAATAIQALGAVAALCAVLLWLGGSGVPQQLPLMVTFLVLTIAGERLELARAAIKTGLAETLAIWIAGVMLAAAIVPVLAPLAGQPVFGAALIAQVAWLWRYDIARNTIRGTGITRYMAFCLLSGYIWLAVSGPIWVGPASALSGRFYDAAIHTAFIGFVLSMIMAHAPVILPAVLRVSLPYTPLMYGPAALLQLGLAIRVGLGDFYDIELAVQIGGTLNVLAVILFAATVIFAAIRMRRARASHAQIQPQSQKVPDAET